MKKAFLAQLGLVGVLSRFNHFPISTKSYTIKTTKNGKKVKVYNS